MHLCELEVNLVYIESYRSTKARYETLSQKEIDNI